MVGVAAAAAVLVDAGDGEEVSGLASVPPAHSRIYMSVATVATDATPRLPGPGVRGRCARSKWL